MTPGSRTTFPILVLLGLLGLLAMHVASAQELEPVVPVPTPADVKTDAIVLVAQPVTPVAVADGSPVEVEFRVTGQGGSDNDGGGIPSLHDIRLRGLASASSADGEPSEVRLLVTEIERAGALAPLSGFGSSWPAHDENDLVLSLSDEVEIEGDRQALSEALAALDGTGQSATSRAREQLEVRTTGQESTQGASSGAGGSEGAAGGATSGYTQPTPVVTEADALVETRETKTGCIPRIDFALRVAIDQIRDETYTDGSLTDTGDCYDSYHEGDKFPLERDYSACPVKIDLGGLTATGRFRWFYRNGDGNRIDVASGDAACVDDLTRTYAIAEDHAACKVAVDYTALTATPQARLVYEGGDGIAVEVRACRPSTSREAVPLTLNTNICPQPESGQQMVAHTYTLDGALHQPDACAPSGTTIESRTDYADCGVRIDLTLGVAFRQVRDRTIQDGTQTKSSECYDSYAAADRFRLDRDYAACEADVDLGARSVTSHFRLRYTDAEGIARNARECSADQDRVYAIFEDHACAIEHSGGMAIRQSRLVYQTRDGIKHEVRGCAPSEDPSRAPVAMTFNTEVCGNPDGTAATKTFSEQGRYEYVLDGVTRRHGDCQNTGRRIQYRADHEACQIEVDEAAETVFKRFKIETVVDGGVESASPCMKSASEPGNQPMERDYAACTDIVDIDRMRKKYRFRYVYTDPHNSRRVSLECRDATDRVFALSEDHEGCSIAVDSTKGKATPQSRIVYRDSEGVIKVARACQASETRDAITLVRNTELCSVRPGDQDGIFQEKAIWTYKTGDTVNQVGECEETGVTYEYTTDYSSCDIRVDHRLKAAIRQVKKQTYRNSVKIAETECRDSAELADRFAFEKSYSACEIVTDTDTLTATTYYKWIYTDHQGNQKIATGAPGADGQNCVADADRTYAITEDHDSCTHHVDYNELEVTPRARLVYRTQDGRVHQVRGCETSSSRESVDLVKRTDLCTKEHDISAGKSYQLEMHTYSIGGLTYQADTCKKTQITYSHEKHYADCDPVIDRSNSRVTRQYQTRIRVDGVYEYVVSICAADPNSARIPIQSTTDGCNDPEFWIHDISAGITYGLERLYYIETGSSIRTYVTPNCIASETTYRHDVETVGYQNHDDEKFSYALSRVSISTDDGVHVIRQSEVLPGSPKIDYILDRTVDLPPTERKAGDRTYEGCNAFDRTDRTEVHTRPDDTEFSLVIGDGDPTGPTNVCDYMLSDWNLKPHETTGVTTTTGRSVCSTVCTSENNNGFCRSWRTTYRGTRTGVYEGHRRLTREDGTVVSSVSATRSHTRYSSCGNTGAPAASTFSNPLKDLTLINQWLVELGWK